MPVQLAQTLRLKLDYGRSNRLCDGEGGGVDLAERAALAGNGLRRMILRVVHE